MFINYEGVPEEGNEFASKFNIGPDYWPSDIEKRISYTLSYTLKYE